MERTLTQLQKEAIALESFFPHFMRERAERFFFAMSVLALSFSVLCMTVGTQFAILWPVSQGLFLTFFALHLVVVMLEAYHRSLYRRLQEEKDLSFPALTVLMLHPRFKDLSKAFLYSRWGKEAAKRLGIAKESVKHFLKDKAHVELSHHPKGFLHDVGAFLHEQDEHLRDFLTRSHVDRSHWVSVLEMIEKKHHRKTKARSFWGPLFADVDLPSLNFEELTRAEIEDLEHVYRILFTEQGIRLIVLYFRDNPIDYLSEDARTDFLVGLIEESLIAHAERLHGAEVIMPADVRRYIHEKIQ